jgi:hypothetical protein
MNIGWSGRRAGSRRQVDHRPPRAWRHLGGQSSDTICAEVVDHLA